MTPDSPDTMREDLERVLGQISTFFDSLVEEKILSRAKLSYSLGEESTQYDRFAVAVRDLVRCIDVDEVHNESGRLEEGGGEKREARDCRKCRKRFATESLLGHHMSQVHGVASPQGIVESSSPLPFFCCHLCYGSFRTKEDFSSHECSAKGRARRGARPDYFGDPRLLGEHNRFRCGYCLEDFRICARVSAHLARCRGPPFRCHLCTQDRFETRRALDDHKEREHRGERPFRCELCQRGFQLRNSLRKHMAQAHAGAEGGRLQAARSEPAPSVQFPCEMCGKKFVNRLYLTNHMTRFHNVTKQFLCQVCGDTFTTGETTGYRG